MDLDPAPPGMNLTCTKTVDIFHVNWLAGFLNHQQCVKKLWDAL